MENGRCYDVALFRFEPSTEFDGAAIRELQGSGFFNRFKADIPAPSGV